MASTRIMPIELLLPKGSPARPQPTAASGVDTVPRRFRVLKRVAGHLLLATLTVLAVALWKLPLRQYVRARSLPPGAATAAPTVASGERGDARASQSPQSAAANDGLHAAARDQSAAGSAAVPDSSLAEGAPGAARAAQIGMRAERTSRRRGRNVADAGSQGGSASLQRRAVELVIGGDLAGAENAYRALADTHPDDRAFHEAARILAARRGQ